MTSFYTSITTDVLISQGMDLEWCKQSDEGLPKPDLVLLLNLSTEAMNSRIGFGEERYEKDEIQTKVSDVFKNMKDSTWKVNIYFLKEA